MKRIIILVLTISFITLATAYANGVYKWQPGEKPVPLVTVPIPMVAKFLTDLNKKEGDKFVLQGYFQYAGDRIAIAGNGETAPSCCYKLLVLHVKHGAINKIGELSAFNCEVVTTKVGDVKIVGYFRGQAYVHTLMKNADGTFKLRQANM